MNLAYVLSGVNYGLVFFFGASLSVSIAGGCKTRREWVLLSTLCPVFLALQTISWLVLGLDTTKQLYPLLIHLPLLAVLVFGLKRPVMISLVSICTAYLCCQLPRCGDITVTALTGSVLAGEITYTLIIAPIFLFLLRYFVPSARDTMNQSPKSLFLFGGLPIIYYVFDYTTAIYSDLLYSGSELVAELLPTAVGLLYMVYTTAYRHQLQRQTQTELLNSLMAGHLKQAEAERMGARLTLETALPDSVMISDTKLCALLSNGLENALNAVGALKENRRWVEFYCGVRLDKLLIEIKNPYAGHLLFRDGLPVSVQPGHGHGCRSIQAIAKHSRGLCEFKAENGIFTLRVALPLC